MDQNRIDVSPQLSSSESPPSTLDPGVSHAKIGGQEVRERAQEKVVWTIIIASFATPLILTIAFMWRDFQPHNPPYSPFQLQDVMALFSTFLSLITLAIGYLFGERKR
jgi:hypothetical protein